MYTQMYAQENPQRSRQRMIVGVMLALLLMSVGVAWWISHHRQAASHRGGEILAEIRSAGLNHFWGEGTQEFFIMRRNGENVGWRATLRKPTTDGWYTGLDVHMHEKDRVVMWEAWTLRNDLRSGTYVAMGPSILGPRLLATTQIVLENGQVEVTETLLDLSHRPRPGRSPQAEFAERQHYTSRTTVPENYLPEGSLPLATRRVGERKVNASFKIVLNETPPLQTGDGRLTTRLGSVQAEFSGTEKLPGPRSAPTTVVTITHSGFGREQAERTYWSPNGELQRTAYDQAELVSVTQEELLSVFPNAWTELTNLKKNAAVGYDEVKEDDAVPALRSSESEAGTRGHEDAETE